MSKSVKDQAEEALRMVEFLKQDIEKLVISASNTTKRQNQSSYHGVARQSQEIASSMAFLGYRLKKLRQTANQAAAELGSNFPKGKQ